MDYNYGVSDAVFLFDKDVTGYLDRLRKKATDLGLNKAKLKSHPPTQSGREDIVEILSGLETDLAEEFPRMIAAFKPYLKLGNI
jgi:hypothetical protein